MDMEYGVSGFRFQGLGCRGLGIMDRCQKGFAGILKFGSCTQSFGLFHDPTVLRLL